MSKPSTGGWGHPASLEVLSVKRPILAIDGRLLSSIEHFINACSNECMWYSLVDADYSHNNCIVYNMTDMFIPYQECAGKEVEDKDPNKMWQEVRTSRNLTVSDVGDLMARAGCWAHSHIAMDVSPSDQDKSQWKEIVTNTVKSKNPTPQIMLIVNRKREYTAWIYDHTLGLEFRAVDLLVNYPWTFDDVDNALKTKCTLVARDTVDAVKSNQTSTSSGSSTTTSTMSATTHEPGGFVYCTHPIPIPAKKV